MNLVCSSNDTQAEHARIRELNAASQAARESRKQLSHTFSHHKTTSFAVPPPPSSTLVGTMDTDCYYPDSPNLCQLFNRRWSFRMFFGALLFQLIIFLVLYR